jgi:hypothetical protein
MENHLGQFQFKTFVAAIEEGARGAGLPTPKQKSLPHYCWALYNRHLVRTIEKAIERARTTDETVKEIIGGL